MLLVTTVVGFVISVRSPRVLAINRPKSLVMSWQDDASEMVMGSNYGAKKRFFAAKYLHNIIFDLDFVHYV